MKKILSRCFLIFFCSCFASAADMNIDQGKTRVSGGAWFNYVPTGRSTYTISPSVSYFLWDQWAIGASIRYHTDSNSFGNNFEVGANALYFFWAGERTASFVETEVSYYLFSSSSPSIKADALVVRPSIGLEYFVVPSVAFGPELVFTAFPISSGGLNPKNSISLTFNLSVYLDLF